MTDFYRFEEKDQKKAKKSTIDFKLIIGVVLILISIGITITSGVVALGGIYSLSDNAAYSAVYLLAPVTVILFLSSLVLLTGKDKRGRNFLIFSILASMLSFGNLSTSINQAYDEAQKEKVAIEKITNIYKDFVSQKDIIKEDIPDEKYGKSRELIRVIQEKYIDFKDITKEIDSISDIVKDTSTFSSETFRDSDSIKEKIARLENISKDIMEVDNKIEEFVDKFKYDLSNVYISKKVKEEIMADLEEEFFSSVQTSTRSLKLKNAIAVNMKDMLTYIDEKQGAFDIKNEKVLFYEDKDDKEFNVLFGLYNRAVDEYTWHYQYVLENSSKKIEELEQKPK